MRRQHFQDQLVRWLAPHSKRDQRAVGIVLIAIRVSEYRQRFVIEARKLWILFPTHLALKHLHFVESV